MVNSDRCTECRRKRDVADTVLVLCDKCPRAFHLGCLRMTEDQLPAGDWKCPRCVEKEAYVQQRYREILHLKRLLEVRGVDGQVAERQPSQSLSIGRECSWPLTTHKATSTGQLVRTWRAMSARVYLFPNTRG